MLRADTHGTTALIFLSSILCDKPGLHTLTSNVRAVPERQHLLPHAGRIFSYQWINFIQV